MISTLESSSWARKAALIPASLPPMMTKCMSDSGSNVSGDTAKLSRLASEAPRVRTHLGTLFARRDQTAVRDDQASTFARMPSYAPAFVRPTDVRESPSSVGAPEHTNDFLADEAALNEEARIRIVATPPVGKKPFIGEESEQFVLARPDREALANTVIKFAVERGFIALQRRDDLWKRPEARKSAGRESRSRQQKR